MSEEKEVKKTEEEILFPDVEVAGIIVKPWTFGKLFQISNDLDELINILDEKNILLSLENDLVSMSLIMKVFTIATGPLMNLITKSADVDEEKINSLTMEDGIKLVYTIFYQNWETIKNAMTPLLISKNKVGVGEEKEKK